MQINVLMSLKQLRFISVVRAALVCVCPHKNERKTTDKELMLLVGICIRVIHRSY